MLRNLSCPAVSQSCRRTLRPSTYTFLVTKKAPVVDVTFLGSNLFCVYRWSRLVFPTPMWGYRGEILGGHGECEEDEPVLPMTTILASMPCSYLVGEGRSQAR